MLGRLAGETLVLARVLLAVLGDADYTITRSAIGKELDGARYERLFDTCPPRATSAGFEWQNSSRPGDGTGIVHIAPAYGEDDLKLGQQYHLPSCMPWVRTARSAGGLARRRHVLQGRDPMITEILRERASSFARAKAA